MAWNGANDARPSVRIASLAPALQRTERRVAEAIAQDRGRAVELTAQELAEWVGVGRTTVIRAAQSLGYEGYPQLRVALVQELALETASAAASVAAGVRVAGSAPNTDTSALGVLRSRVAQVAARLGDTTSALTADSVETFLATLDSAARVLVVANGLSGPLGLALVMRLNAAGRSVEYFTDPLAQQIAARQLGAGSACIVFSGSGANRQTLDTMESARESGATVIAFTSFARSAVVELADTVLVVPPINDSFSDELIHTSRAALMLLSEELVDLFVERRGERGVEARAAALAVLASAIKE
ncbi:MurR/RpiR family transcriptional regulator [Leucobacter sp. UT-8R-CII-1-4]|uniref:MurR/RpiR family transcriptional regulator n=1 Tax=Leucobacter sp. UT-8R-CII-1-4 TaxID=3040075 RepID=UPI0024A7DB56|nr:MurR/RpiR family transcriptional regulator [Leucobacter sp. UT-8R-CII-1-4]MDI6023381.1 MurR/RpiR family transcriptional regulator [Leucobacter sp. UT-8R-CII-1-4]